LKFYGLQRKEISKIRAIERAFIDVLWSTLVVVSESCSRPTPCFLDLATRAYAGVYLLHKICPRGIPLFPCEPKQEEYFCDFFGRANISGILELK
jgi:hypothetical protein